MARNVTVIPARPRTAEKKQNNGSVRVAAYCRVSTDAEDQLHSFSAQVDYYTNYINGRADYTLAGIYADEGISGTNTKKREDFKRLIKDCEDGKIDLVITKSISRFARNTQDCLAYSRRLKDLGIGIIFEKEHINTLESTGELLFTILSSLAQDESRNISENCKWGIRSRFKKGQFHIDATTFLGYDKDEDGKLVINEEQAKTVRRIYDEFLAGKTPSHIARDLEKEGIRNGKGNNKWYPSNITGILTNEKHMGDALLQKYYTADFLTKKQVRNRGEVTQYYVTDSHEGIIDKDTWNAVKEELERRDDFLKRHGMSRYSHAADWSPFSGRLFCDKCKRSYTRHAWKSRNRVQWQCQGHRTDGTLTCTNQHVFEEDLIKAFLKAYGALYKDKEALIRKKEEQIRKGTPLQRVRAEQMLELVKQPPMEEYSPQIAQRIIEEVTIIGPKEYVFAFLDGSVRRVRV